MLILLKTRHEMSISRLPRAENQEFPEFLDVTPPTMKTIEAHFLSFSNTEALEKHQISIPLNPMHIEILIEKRKDSPIVFVSPMPMVNVKGNMVHNLLQMKIGSIHRSPLEFRLTKMVLG